MKLAFLRSFDRWLGIVLLYLLALPVHAIGLFLPVAPDAHSRHIFLKLKGGGSLIIALPSLLGLRQKYPQAEFILVCTAEAKIYADLTGIFDRTLIVDDTSLLTLVLTGWHALRASFRAALCVDLEPNSLLAAVFTLLTCAGRRIGLVKLEQPVRAVAYTTSLSFNPSAPIYIYYDQICETLGATPLAASVCREAMRKSLPAPELEEFAGKTIGIAAFTSDLARERMMPSSTWAALLQQAYGAEPLRILIFGSARNQYAAEEMGAILRAALPAASVTNLCGVCDLRHAAARLAVCDEVWAVDSGLLHITRALGVANRSFWGPTMPSQRLRPVAGLAEQVRYRPFICSPCVHSASAPPCGGHNICMISMAEESPNLRPSWVQTR